MKKNLLVISHSYNSFQKNAIENVADLFDTITVFVRANSFAEIGQYTRLPYFDLFSSKYKIDLTNKPQNIEIFKVPIPYLPTDRGYKKLGEKHFTKVNSLIKTEKIDFDIVHAHFTWSAGYVGAKLKERYNVPFVVNARGYDIYQLPFQDDEWKKKITYVLNSADQIITTSESNLPYIKRLNVIPPVTVIPNAFHHHLFYPKDPIECRRKLGLPNSKKIVLTVGNLKQIKGHRYLIDAIREIHQTDKNVICIIVGGGELKQDLNRQIISNDLQDVAILAGKKPYTEIPDWINSCDLFVLPSLQESFGTVQIEALACGKPVVATKNGGSEWIIISDTYGYLVEIGDSQDLAKKIDRGLTNAWNHEEICRYAEQYTVDNFKKKISIIYEKLPYPDG